MKTEDNKSTRKAQYWTRPVFRPASRFQARFQAPRFQAPSRFQARAYYGITGNSASVSGFRLWAVRAWRKWLSRRNRERGMAWDRFNQLLDRYPLPAAVAIHSTCRRAASP